MLYPAELRAHHADTTIRRGTSEERTIGQHIGACNPFIQPFHVGLRYEVMRPWALKNFVTNGLFPASETGYF